MSDVLKTANITEKINCVDRDLHKLLSSQPNLHAPASLPARDIQILDVRGMPARAPLHTREGLGRLLHDLASIELQAVELGIKTLIDFKDAPQDFRFELADITRQEAKHLQLCLQELESLGHQWGDWPVHIGLWHGALRTDNLLDRILMVHRHLEGSGLDAGESILRKLSGAKHKSIVSAVRTIVHEEIAHVEFGSKWYRNVCSMQKIEADEYFKEKMSQFIRWAPRREKVATEARLKAGFNLTEIGFLEKMRSEL